MPIWAISLSKADLSTNFLTAANYANMHNINIRWFRNIGRKVKSPYASDTLPLMFSNDNALPK